MTTAPPPSANRPGRCPARRDRPLGHRGRHRRRCPRHRRGGVPALRARRRWAGPSRCCAGRCRSPVAVDAVVAIGVRPVGPLPGAPLGGHRRGGLHAHRLADPHLDAGADLAHPDRRRHPRRAAAAVRPGHGRGADGVVSRARCGSAPRAPTSPSGWPTTWPRAGGPGPRPGDVTEPDPARRTSPRVVLVHTVTFRQARQFVPAASSRSPRPPASAAGRRRSSRWSSASPCCRWARGARPGGGSATPTARPPWSSPAGCCPARCAPCPTTGSAASRSRRRCCTGCSAWCGCASTRPPGRCTGKDEELRRRRRHPRRGRPAARPPSSPTGAGRRRPDGGRRRPSRRAGRGGDRPVRQPAGCSTRRWSAATSRCPLAAVGALFRLRRRAARRFRPEFDGPDLSDVRGGRRRRRRRAGAARRRRRRRRRRRELAASGWCGAAGR